MPNKSSKIQFLLTEFTKTKQLLRIKATSVMISEEKQEAEDIKSKFTVCGRQHYGFITPAERKQKCPGTDRKQTERIKQSLKPRVSTNAKQPRYCLNKYAVLKVIIAQLY